MKQSYDVIILGGGPAGIAATIWCKRLGIDHLLIESKAELGGQLFKIYNQIIDYPGLPVENGSTLQQLFVKHIQELSCDYIVNTTVHEFDILNRKMTITSPGSLKMDIHFQHLILAMGSSKRCLGIPGEQEMMDRGEVFSPWKDKDFNGKTVLVVGGGDEAFESCLLLAECGAHVLLAHRSERFRAQPHFIDRVLSSTSIELLTNTKLTQIVGTNQVTGAVFKDADGREAHLSLDAVIIRVGVEPNSQLVRGQIDTDENGYVLVDAVGKTSAPSVYAIGDICTKPAFSSISTAVGQAMLTIKHLSIG